MLAHFEFVDPLCSCRNFSSHCWVLSIARILCLTADHGLQHNLHVKHMQLRCMHACCGLQALQEHICLFANASETPLQDSQQRQGLQGPGSFPGTMSWSNPAAAQYFFMSTDAIRAARQCDCAAQTDGATRRQLQKLKLFNSSVAASMMPPFTQGASWP